MQPQHLESAPTSKYVRNVAVDVVPLDDYCVDLPSGGVSLKIDTQGFELEVLQGATAMLARTSMVRVELSLAALYEGQPDYVEVICYLRDRGYRLTYLEPGFEDPTTGELLQADVIMVADHRR
jgi:hypothetical protein